MPTDKRQRQKQGREQRLQAMRAQQKKQQQKKRVISFGVLAVVLAMVALLFSLGGDGGGEDEVATDASTSTTAADGSSTTAAATDGPPKGEPVAGGAKLDKWACPKADGSSPRTDQFPSEQPPTCIDPKKKVTATLDTTQGTIEIALDTNKTPDTANNFAVLSRYHYYDGTVITRIDDSIDIIQTGSPKTQTISDPGPGYTIKDEGQGFTYGEGDVVMARSSGPDSAGAQYFVVTGPKASALNGQGTYVTFGKITKGLDVAKTIAGLFQPCSSSDSACLGGAPKELVTIKTITITES